MHVKMHQTFKGQIAANDFWIIGVTSYYAVVALYILALALHVFQF